MKFNISHILILAFVVGFAVDGIAYRPFKNDPQQKSNKTEQKAELRANCMQATQDVDLDINNVRARLMNGGDMWWDLQGNGRYIVPKVEPGSGQLEVSSMFAGAVWLGGRSTDGNLKIAAQTYRDENNNDFFPGPLDDDGEITEEECENWDQFFHVTGDEIREHLRLYEEFGDDYSEEMIPDGVKYYPGAGNPYFTERYDFSIPTWEEDSDFSGYYWNKDNNPNYDPLEGDFPYIQVRGCPKPGQEADELLPDDMYFWIYNDNGNVHTASEGSTPIEMEIQVQAFAYRTQDELNNMTFYRYRLINEAQTGIEDTYFAMWVDPDLGCSEDDYIGCDTTRSLMYVYNEDAVDGQPGSTCLVGGTPTPTYGNDVPMVGVDYFRGPLDREGNELGMSSFTYYNRAGTEPNTAKVDPQSAGGYYNYLTGNWRTGQPFTYGGDGFQTGQEIDYAFTDDPQDENGWSMVTANIPVADRRTIQASGPFFLEPGAVNELIVGVVWVPSVKHPAPSLAKIRKADDKAQALFDNCFDILDGPDAPDMSIVELDQKAIFLLTNDTIESNNAFESYEENIQINVDDPDADTTYNFQGYRVYQLAGPNAENTPDGRRDPSQARLVFQTDIKDNISTIFNWDVQEDPTNPNREIAIPTQQVDGPNTGLRSTFLVTNNQFTGDPLKNNQKYYYTVVAYAYNQYEEFDPDTLTGQETPYIEGRQNIEIYTVIPRQSTWLDVNAAYGQGFEVTQLDGLGTGGNFLRLTDESREAAFNNTANNKNELTYLPGFTPINLKVVNPLDVKAGDYSLRVYDNNQEDGNLDFSSAKYELVNKTTGDTLTTRNTLLETGELLAGEFGFSLFLKDVESPGRDNNTATNGAVGEMIEFENPDLNPWFGFYAEGSYTDWIQSEDPTDPANPLDPTGAFSTEVMEGPFYPFALGNSSRPYDLDNENASPTSVARPVYYGGGVSSMSQVIGAGASLENLPNVDVVFTPDKSKWSRCIVLETHNRWYPNVFNGIDVNNVGNAPNMGLRRSPSVTKEDADGDGKADLDTDEPREGFAWFPGYAIDVTTGKRLNIFFGENSLFNDDFPYDTLDVVQDGNYTAEELNTGADMMWNPVGLDVAGMNTTTENPLYYANGSHFIYISNTEYDGCDSLHSIVSTFESNSTIYYNFLGSDLFNWVAMPNISQRAPLNSYAEGLIPDRTVVSVRVDEGYENRDVTGENDGNPFYEFSISSRANSMAVDESDSDSLLKHVVAVPNPYRGLSGYEVDAAQNIVKITNLPPQCDVTIYSLDGKFIRQYSVNESYRPPATPSENNLHGNPGAPRTYYNSIVEWDLKNNAGIPIASGVYLIHIDAPGIGEKVIKWFGVNRKFDPSIF